MVEIYASSINGAIVPYSTATIIEGEQTTAAPSGDQGSPSTSSTAASTTATLAPPPPASASVPAQPPASFPPPAPSNGPSEAPAPSSAPPSSPAASPSSAPSASQSSYPIASSGSDFTNAISYSPYNSDGSCKTSQQVSQDLSQLTDGYDLLRLYGTDCNQVSNVLAATQGKNVQIFAGVFDVGQVQSEVSTLISAVNGDWSRINTVSIGNEAVNDGTATVGQVTGAIGQARSQLSTAGYHGPVVTVDTMEAMSKNIELCAASDYCAINCHPFFDGGVAADGAGPWVLDWAQNISSMAGGKTTKVTETGWPTQGGTNGKAVPSEENQQAAISSLKGSFSNNMILFSSYNNYWQPDSATTFGTEHFWGINGNAPSSN